MIIDKQAMFAVRMAKVLEERSAQHKTEVLQQIHPKARKLINIAFCALAKKRYDDDNAGNSS